MLQCFCSHTEIRMFLTCRTCPLWSPGYCSFYFRPPLATCWAAAQGRRGIQWPWNSVFLQGPLCLGLAAKRWRKPKTSGGIESNLTSYVCNKILTLLTLLIRLQNFASMPLASQQLPVPVRRDGFDPSALSGFSGKAQHRFSPRPWSCWMLRGNGTMHFRCCKKCIVGGFWRQCDCDWWHLMNIAWC